MTVQITIIGLGQIGSSMGLALKARNVDIRVVGHDKEPQAAKQAQKKGAVDDTKYNLPASVRDAQIVILAIPFSGIRETLEIIAPDLQEGTVVFATAPSKATVGAWAAELLPQGRHYVGLTPAINPEYVHGIETGVDAARADMFNKGLIVVNIPTGTPEEVFTLAMDFVSLVGATPLVMDTAEADGTFAAIDLLPRLAAAALLDATVDKPGWLEARKLAGRPFASVSSGAAYDDVQSLRDSVLENRDNMLRLLSSYIASLVDLRDEISDNDKDALSNRLQHSLEGRSRWLKERRTAEWLNKGRDQVDVPSLGQKVNRMFFGSMFTGGRSKSRNK